MFFFFGSVIDPTHINFATATKSDVALTDQAGTAVVKYGALQLPWPTVTGWQKEGMALKNSFARANGVTMVAFVRNGDVQNNDGTHNYNAAVGWNASQNPANPIASGDSVVVNNNAGTQGNTGYLGIGTVALTNILRQVPFYVMVILRSSGAAFYAGGTLSGAADLPGYPTMRLIGLDTANTDTPVYPFAFFYPAETVIVNFVYGMSASIQAAWNAWYGTAIMAAALTTVHATIIGSNPDGTGSNPWTFVDVSSSGGTFQTDAGGAYNNTFGNSYCIADTGASISFIRMDINAASGATQAVGLMARYIDSSHYIRIEFDPTATYIQQNLGSGETTLAGEPYHINTNALNTVTLADYNGYMVLTINGVVAWQDGTQHNTLAGATKCGFQNHFAQNTMKILNFEAHGTVVLPTSMRISAPYARQGASAIATDTFGGTSGQDLAGNTTTTGGLVWVNQALGGVIQYAGSNTAKLASSPTGDADYTLALTNKTFADVQITARAGTSSSWTGAHFFAGCLFWQDASNYIFCRTFIDVGQTNASEIELRVIYGGVTVNTERVQLGSTLAPNITSTLRMSFDGTNYAIWLNSGEPVLCSSLTRYSGYAGPLVINSAGVHISSTDVGSILSNFVLMQ